MHPAAEVEVVVDAVHHPQSLHERLLGDVLCQQRITELAPHESEDRRDVAAVQLLEGVDVPVSVRADELDIGRLAGGWRDLSFL